MTAGFWWGNVRKRDHFEYRDTYKSVILKWILQKEDWRAWTGFTCYRAGCCEDSNESPVSVKCGNFLTS